jgi:AcrR family transcriptional regulator
MKVNEKKRGRPAKSQSVLGKKQIISVAKQLMESSGSIPSIRKLSAELNVDAMAIYYYFKNKNHLLEEITTSLISDIYCPLSSDNWQLELLTLCKSYLTLLERYDGLLATLLTMDADGPAQVFVSRFKFITQSLSLSVEDENTFLNLLVDYVHGFAFAKSCDTKQILKIDNIDKPFQLICKSIV